MLILWLLASVSLALATRSIASRKGYPTLPWTFFGLMFPLIAVIVVAVLRDRTPGWGISGEADFPA